MPFFIVHVSGRSSRKQARTDPPGFSTYDAAEETAKARYHNGDYFIVEADDEPTAGQRAIAESRPLDQISSSDEG
jgi:hypothetical protein